MIRKIKLFVWFVGFLLMLGIGVVLVITNLVDPNDYKPKLEQLVESNTGRQLTLQGDLGLTFYPWLGIRAEALTLSNRNGFGDTPMFSVAQTNIRIKLLPLLRKKLEIGAITLNKPKIHLLTLPNGTNNWDDLLGGSKSSEAHQRDDDAKDDVFGLAGLAIQGISLADAEIVWDNRNSGQVITFSNLHLSTSKIQSTIPLDIALSARVDGNVIPRSALINFSSTANIDENLTVINLHDTSVAVDIGEQQYQLTLPDLTVDIAQQSASVPAFSLSRDDVKVSGLLNLSNLFVSPTVSGHIKMTAPNFGEILSAQGIDAEYIEQQSGQRFGKIAVNTAFGYLNDTVQMSSFTADIVLNGQDTKVDIPFVSLNVLRQQLKLPALRIWQDGSEINTDLMGDALFSEPQSMRLSGSLNLHITDFPDFIERNHLGDVLPKDMLKTITSKMDYALNHGDLLLSSMNTVADETVLNGSIVVSNLMIEPNNEPDKVPEKAPEKAVKLAVKQNIQNINLGRILTAWDITNVLVGTGTVNLNLTDININATQPLSNMAGQIELDVRDGAIKGFDLQAALIKLNTVRNRATAKQHTYETDTQTKFSELSGRFKGINGHFQTNNLSLHAPGLRVKGMGSLNLPNQLIDMNFDVAIVKSLEGQGGKGLENLESLRIPLTVTGNLTAPNYELDLSTLLKQQTTEKVREMKKTVTKQLLKLLGN